MTRPNNTVLVNGHPWRGQHNHGDGLTAKQHLEQHITPLKRALADAEWQAMDERGRLSDDWPAIRAEIEHKFRARCWRTE